MLFNPSPSSSGKPNRLDSERYPNKNTNEEYHLDYGKWAWGAGNDYRHQEWVEKTVVNIDTKYDDVEIIDIKKYQN